MQKRYRNVLNHSDGNNQVTSFVKKHLVVLVLSIPARCVYSIRKDMEEYSFGFPIKVDALWKGSDFLTHFSYGTTHFCVINKNYIPRNVYGNKRIRDQVNFGRNVNIRFNSLTLT